MYVCMYVYIYTHTHTYIYIYIKDKSNGSSFIVFFFSVADNSLSSEVYMSDEDEFLRTPAQVIAQPAPLHQSPPDGKMEYVYSCVVN